MKKLIFVSMVLAAILMITGTAMATAQWNRNDTRSLKNGGHLVAAVDVSGDSNSVTISAGSDADIKKLFEGLLLWNIKLTPGTGDEAPSGTVDVTIACGGWSLTWSALSNTTTSIKSIYEADSPPSTPPMITGDITITVSNLGSGNTAVLEPIFW